jgi:5-methylcytosine-specific restriction endonuclease McrA
VSHHHPKGRKPWLRWDEDNAAAFCVGCHLFWWHRYPAEAVAWLMKYLGPKRYEALGIRAGTRRSEPDFYLLQLALTKRYGELTRAA